MSAGRTPRKHAAEATGSTRRRPEHEVLIVGAGFGGIGAGVALREKGIENFVILDEWDGVGGAWHANTYPGVQVDIPSLVYSYSFDQRADWSRLFAPGSDLKRYADDVVDKNGLRPKLRLGRHVVSSTWDAANHLWETATADGEMFTSRFLVGAVGPIEVPKLPAIEGIETFAGKVIHSALWDHDYDLTGKRVAVIGTGASAVQLIPRIAETVEHLTVFQRRAIYVAPKPDWEAGPVTRFALRNVVLRQAVRFGVGAAVAVGTGGILLGGKRARPVLTAAGAMCNFWTRIQLRGDKELMNKLKPTYTFGCKRPTMSNTYLKTYTRPNVELITESLTYGTKRGLATADGREYEFDAFICATGFKVGEPDAVPFELRGRAGSTLEELWVSTKMQAYQGVSVPNFPNAFLTVGPYGYAPSSFHSYVEASAAHLSRAIRETLDREATSCEIRQDVHDRYLESCLNRIDSSGFVPLCAGSNTYYINSRGETAALRPATQPEMWARSRYFNLDNYQYETLVQPPTEPPAAFRNALSPAATPTFAT